MQTHPCTKKPAKLTWRDIHRHTGVYRITGVAALYIVLIDDAPRVLCLDTSQFRGGELTYCTLDEDIWQGKAFERVEGNLCVEFNETHK